MSADDVALAQTEELITDINVKDISIEASIEKALTIRPTQEAITVPNPDAPVVTWR